jgi:hypothetical protein
MAVSYVSTSAAVWTGLGSATLWAAESFTGCDFAIVAIVTDEGTDLITDVSIDGTPMTLAYHTSDTGGGYCGQSGFYLAGPTDGDVTFTQSGSKNHRFILTKFSGVDQTTPVGAFVDAGTAIATSRATGTITGVDATGMFFAWFCFQGGTAAHTYGGSETSRYDQTGDPERMAVCTLPGAATANITVTKSDATRINAGGVYIKSDEGAAAGPSIGARYLIGPWAS